MDRLTRQRRRTERQRAYMARLREQSPEVYQERLARNAAYRRERAAIDPEYRHERNIQAK
jgi:alkylhydroperoxidase/carboxymuconolactone decarboxylase family protein YurZ